MPDTGDTISVRCECGKKLKAPASAAGRRAKCPACGNVVTFARTGAAASSAPQSPPPPPPIPDSPLDDMYDVASDAPPAVSAVANAANCPSCGSPVQPGAVLCVSCGYDFRTGKKLGVTSGTVASPSAAERYEASKQADREKRNAPGEKGPIPIWAWLFVIGCGVIPILTLGGAIPGAIGFGGAGACLATSRNESTSTGVRIAICAAITVGCWTLFIVLIGGILFLKSR